MTSRRQTAANRGNARRSTGPRSTQGRARSAMNALKHGLRARTVLLEAEDEEEFRRARANLLADLAPRGFLEEALADNVVSAWWQLKRAQGVETTVLDWELVAAAQAQNQRRQAALARRLGDRHLGDGSPALEPELAAKLGALLDNKNDPDARAFNDLVAQQRALEVLRQGLERQPGHAFARDAGGGDVLAKLSRYLTAAQRRFHAALREFERVSGNRDRESGIESQSSSDFRSLVPDHRPPPANRAGRRRAAKGAEREAPS